MFVERRFFRPWGIVAGMVACGVVCGVLGGVAGCGGGDASRTGNSVVEGEPPPILDLPPPAADFREGIEKLTSMRDTMRDAFAAKDIDKAHGPLHEVGHLLEALPGLFEKEVADEASRAAVRKEVDELFDQFGKVDAKLHGEKGADYADVSRQIDEALERLRARVM